MKIALIGQKGYPSHGGGIEKHVEFLTKWLRFYNHEVFLYVRKWYMEMGANEKNEDKGINIIYKSSIRTKNLDTISHVFLATWHAIWQDYDVIHFQGIGPTLMSFLARIFRFIFRKKFVIVATFHSIDRLHQKWGFFAKKFLKLAEWTSLHWVDKTITVSEYLANYCKINYNVETVCIPNGVEDIKNIPIDILKREFDLEKDSFIAIIARLIPVKGHEYLIKAYKKVSHLSSKKLLIVGGSAFTDDYVQKLYKLANNDPKIIFAGDLYGRVLEEVYSNAYFIVSSSEVEGLSFVVLEAMAHGKTILASDIPANLEILEYNGVLFKNKNIDDLAKKLRLLFNYPHLVEDTGRRAKDYVLRNYHWKNLVKKTLDLYRTLRKNKFPKKSK